ncbi:FRG domain-containing protein [Salmonella enterica]|uniref:FRG domain-containing protein n=1 Tax=Salmonella enterica TaxID=28901 RepID=A0A701YZH7_SALER|nr:FRG domain-containing protein [Salmonella enterica]HAC6566707.1 FRG domain-containing protein [Salmonella enterica subsp. indica]HBC0161080.1 FRG domain-containing protein [Salmonella enterica subsp. indica]HCM1934016.1 FRG domain-containing protein [Salmonella enterica subsp. indica serovar 6,7:z41:1,7]HCM1937537.1 FRG domain-containing protein [Salmonella enterica subsp. indica serovar 6,7:z41:1,7]
MSKISTLHGFMSWVKEIKTATDTGPENVALLYRGHADKNWQLQPSAYRVSPDGTSYRYQEYYLYQEMLRKNPNAFEKDKTIFERLVRMQHNGLPTRLLDLTTSALVALFFACESDNDFDGEVLLFKQVQSLILYPHAIPEQSLAGLERQLPLYQIGRMVRDWLFDFFNIKEGKRCSVVSIDNDYGLLIAESKRLLSITGNSVDPTDLIFLAAILQEVIKKIDNFSDTWHAAISEQNLYLNGASYSEVTLFLVQFQHDFHIKLKSIMNLLSEDIGIKSSSSQGIVLFLARFSTPNFVFPHFNNERIKRQQGLFVIYPPIESQSDGAVKIVPTNRVVIKSTAKKIILDDLASLGITRGYLYPELTEQAAELKKIYPTI